jgi:hypothetical protein
MARAQLDRPLSNDHPIGRDEPRAHEIADIPRKNERDAVPQNSSLFLLTPQPRIQVSQAFKPA